MQHTDFLSTLQLDALRLHKWKAREIAEATEKDLNNAEKEDKEGLDSVLSGRGAKDAISGQYADIVPPENAEEGQKEEEEEPFVPLFKVTKAQKEKMISVCTSIQSTCEKLYKDSGLFEQARNLIDDESGEVSDDLVAVALVLKSRIQRDMALKEKKSSRASTSSFKVPLLQDHLIEVNKQEEVLRTVLLEQVMQIAFLLRKQGVIIEPPLEWDGSLGPEEEKV